jgi:hypothetical protein
LRGSRWQAETTPFAGLAGSSLNAVSAISPTEIWSVGDHLIVRYSP